MIERELKKKLKKIIYQTIHYVVV